MSTLDIQGVPALYPDFHFRSYNATRTNVKYATKEEINKLRKLQWINDYVEKLLKLLDVCILGMGKALEKPIRLYRASYYSEQYYKIRDEILRVRRTNETR